jgi:hypothetical protein
MGESYWEEMWVRAMRLNTAQKTILVVSAVVLLCLALFPPWQQAAELETAYRKDLGRSFVLRSPEPIAVDCYFVGCKTAPPSYFHVVLYQELLLAQVVSALGVAVIMLWMFRSRRDGHCASLVSRRTRLEFSVLAALLLPPTGTFPLAWILMGIPKQIISRDEPLLIPLAMVLIIFAACALVVYLLVTLILVSARLRRVAGS